MKYLVKIFLIGLITSAEAQVIDSVPSGKFVVYYELSGEGSPIYILSGGPGIAPHIMNDVTEELSKNHQIVLIHQRGTGKTSGPLNEETIQIANYSRDIKAIKVKLGQKKINLLGHSWGGRLAMDYATRYPDDINKIILIGSAGYNSEFVEYFGDNIMSNLSKNDQKTLQLLERFFNQMPMVNEEGVIAAMNGLEMEYMKISRKGYFYDKSKVDELEISKEDINMQIMRLMGRSLKETNWDLKDELEKNNIETLIVQGRQDPIDLETARAIQSAMVGSELSIIEQCGHFPWIEQPVKFYEVLNAFLEK